MILLASRRVRERSMATLMAATYIFGAMRLYKINAGRTTQRSCSGFPSEPSLPETCVVSLSYVLKEA